MATPPPTYSAQIDNVDMDTGTNALTATNLARDNPSDTSDTETDDSMPDLVPASSVTPDNTTTNNEAHSANIPAGVTTLIQHIGSLSIDSSVTNGVHARRRPSISTDFRRESTNTPAVATTTSGHAHVTKLHGETRVANQAIRRAVLDSIEEETGHHRRFNNNNRRGYTYRVHAPVHPSTNARLFALLERLHRIEVILRRLERERLNRKSELKYTQCECKVF
ncbi:hypothetical protein B0H13DRAFT_1922599 [Mycena leptocephala]|nr:hypothetical protein B0H13DRAFT_1922599 [Mycena leptocephala]